MLDKIILREYKKEDSKNLEDIIRKTWNYERFCNLKTAEKLARFYLINCLADQTYIKVVILDNLPVGIIMGKK